MPPLPGRGHVTQTIANIRAVEALEADIHVAGHGEPGTLADVCAARSRTKGDLQRVRDLFAQGLGYDTALRAFAGDGARHQGQTGRAFAEAHDALDAVLAIETAILAPSGLEV